MITELSRLFSDASVEDERDVLVLTTIATLLAEQLQALALSVEDDALSQPHLATSIDDLFVALRSNADRTEDIPTINQVVASLDRLENLYRYVDNHDWDHITLRRRLYDDMTIVLRTEVEQLQQDAADTLPQN